MSKRRALGALALALPLTIALALNAPAGHAKDTSYEQLMIELLATTEKGLERWTGCRGSGFFLHPRYPDTLLQVSRKQGTLFYRTDLEGKEREFLVNCENGSRVFEMKGSGESRPADEQDNPPQEIGGIPRKEFEDILAESMAPPNIGNIILSALPNSSEAIAQSLYSCLPYWRLYKVIHHCSLLQLELIRHEGNFLADLSKALEPYQALEEWIQSELITSTQLKQKLKERSQVATETTEFISQLIADGLKKGLK